MYTLKGKLLTWSLSEDASQGEKFFLCEAKYGLLRKYVTAYVYDAITDEGEQRIANERHLGRLKSAIENRQYTPQVFNLSVTDPLQVNVDKKGNVEISLSEDNKLAILDGGTRHRALERIRASDEKYHNVVDSLPIPLIVYCEPDKRKENFSNLNNGTKVNKSHLQSLNISSGRMKADKLPRFERAKEISLLLHNSENSPLCGKISFGNTDEVGKIQFSQIATDHAGSLIASLYSSDSLLKLNDSSNEYFVQLFVQLYDLVKERTNSLDKGKLLALPPDGAKGNVSNWISVVNTTFYYLYLREQMDLSYEVGENSHQILHAMQVYDDLVAGDISRRRRQNLSQMYAQRLFSDILEQPECPTGSHFEIPISLLALTSASSFNVEVLPGLKTVRKRRHKNEDSA